MLPQGMDDLDPVVLRPRVARFNIVECRHDKPQMVEALRRAIAGDAPMKRQVVASGGQVGIVGVGLPYGLHPEDARIELPRALDVGNRQRQMPEPAMFDHGDSLPTR